MISFVMCAAAFAACYWYGRRSMVAGMTAVLVVGYVHGIIRANLYEVLAYFIFDFGAIGFYVAQYTTKLSPEEKRKIKKIRSWLMLLILWPTFLLAFQYQEPLVQIVGLRAAVFFLPFLLIGARLDGPQAYRLAISLAVLNLAAFAVAVAEFVLGVETFFPRSHLTEIIYISTDAVEGRLDVFRIPSTFSNSHSYAGTMVMTIPLLAGAWVQKHAKRWHGKLLLVALLASILGVFMAASRINIVVLLLMLAVLPFAPRVKAVAKIAWVFAAIGLGVYIANEPRLQRVLTLQNTELVAERIEMGVNEDFIDLAMKFPFGNGLGGGGTSMPYFLEQRVRNKNMMENEYAHIMLEQGVLGLAIWVTFLVWTFTRRAVHRRDQWFVARRLGWLAAAAYMIISFIGTGAFYAIPQSALLLMMMGWFTVPQPRPRRVTYGTLRQVEPPSLAPAQAAGAGT